jgi:hypothetical protein
MRGYFPFKASGLFFRRLTSQHPLAPLRHAIGLHFFNEAHRVSPDAGSPMHGWSGTAA